ncbi:MAG TPA: serine/threonine-protein kinase [Planctomycetota bacterium]
MTRILSRTPVKDERLVETLQGKQFQPGDVIAGCKILDLLGRGGMGQVYKVEWTGGDDDQPRTQAIKILLPEVCRERAYVEQFVHEAESAMALQHPNIVRTFEAGFKEGLLFQRMEYVQGGDLRKRMKRGEGMHPDAAARIVLTVGRGLAFAHSQGMVHRDVKPDNILVDDARPIPRNSGVFYQRFMLSDMGLIKEVGEPLPNSMLSPDECQLACDSITKQLDRLHTQEASFAEARRFLDEILTAIDNKALEKFRFRPLFDPATSYQYLESISGERTTSIGFHASECLGTPTYMSPEQVEGRKTDERSDIYALGCVFYELIAGRPPFVGDTAAAVVRSKLTDPSPPLELFVPAERREKLPAYERILDTMLQKDRRCRYRHMRYCLQDIERVLTTQDEPWCSNARFLYHEASAQDEPLISEETPDTGIMLLLNLLYSVFEMSE